MTIPTPLQFFDATDAEKIKMMEWSRCGAIPFVYSPRPTQIDKTVVTGTVWVSTIILPTEHRNASGEIVDFETMSFADKECCKPLNRKLYKTREDALAGHAEEVARLLIEVGNAQPWERDQ